MIWCCDCLGCRSSEPFGGDSSVCCVFVVAGRQTRVEALIAHLCVCACMQDRTSKRAKARTATLCCLCAGSERSSGQGAGGEFNLL